MVRGVDLATGDDSLRDRIAQVLHRQFGPSLGAAEGGWDDEHTATKDMYRADADAVIQAWVDFNAEQWAHHPANRPMRGTDE